MTIRKLLANLALQVLCIAAGGADVGVALDAVVDIASTVADVLVGARRIDLDWLRAWTANVPFDCQGLSHDGTPVAPACTND